MSKKSNPFDSDDRMSLFQELMTAAKQAQAQYNSSSVYPHNPSMGMGGMGGSSTFGPGMAMGGMGGSSTFGPGMGMGGMGFPQQGLMFSGPMMGGAGGGHNQMVPFSGNKGMFPNPMSLPEDPNSKKIKELEDELAHFKQEYNNNEEKRHILTKNQQEVTSHLIKHAKKQGCDFGTTQRIQVGDDCPFFVTDLGKKKAAIQNVPDDDDDSGPAMPAPKKTKKVKKTGPSAEEKKRQDLVEKMWLYQCLDPACTILDSKVKPEHLTQGGKLKAAALHNLNENKKLFGYIYVNKDPYTLATPGSKALFAEFKEDNGLPVEDDWDGTI